MSGLETTSIEVSVLYYTVSSVCQTNGEGSSKEIKRRRRAAIGTYYIRRCIERGLG